MDIFSYVAIAIIVVFVYFLFFRNKKAAQKEMNNLNEMSYKSHSNITFDDVAGNYEAKESLKELVDFIKNPKKYKDLNIRTPRGVLLYGTPGTGKTLMAQALAGEAGVDFFAVSGSDFVQVYAGLGAGRIRNLFNKAKKAGKSVIFIDEIDAIGKKRMGGAVRGSDEGDRTLNALLTEMSGFESSEIIVVAATNRIDTLDEALLRPGRFDRQIEIMLPDKEARKDIIKLYLNKVNTQNNIDIDSIAEMTIYFSGAMIENLINEASILAVRDNMTEITQEHIEKSFLQILAGTEQKSNALNFEQKKITAYHEAGHTIASKYLLPENKIIKVSIIPTTKGAGGYTLSTPSNDIIMSKQKIENQLKVFLAGRASEEIFFGYNNITIGAQNDIEKSTSLALDFITKYGMSEEDGLINYNILSKYTNNSMSIENSVKRIISEAYESIKVLIDDHKAEIESIAQLLIEKETIDNTDLENILLKNQI